METPENGALNVAIYQRLMRFLEGRESLPTSGILTIPVTVNGVTKDLRFRRLLGMNSMHSVQSIDDPEVRIFYDPNWESLAKIDKLLAAGAPV